MGGYAAGTTASNSVFSHIVGVLLWADPQYNGDDAGFVDPTYGQGILGARSYYPYEWYGKLMSFCTSLDPVCNYTSISSLLQNVSHHGDERFNPVLCKSAQGIAHWGGFGSACGSSSYDNTDPFNNPYQNCGVSSYLVFSVADKWGGTLQLKWGPSCQTNWARLVPSSSITHRIWVERQLSNFFSVGSKFQFSVPAGVPAWSDQLWGASRPPSAIRLPVNTGQPPDKGCALDPSVTALRRCSFVKNERPRDEITSDDSS